MTIEDTENAVEVYRALRVANGTIELEKAPHKWLVENLIKYGPNSPLGFSTAVILEPLKAAADGEANRAERRRETKAK